jgi:hypothetical protein
MATSGTNITSISKPAVGVDTGPTWADNLNTSLDAIDGHDHSTNKGVRITPAGLNVNADLEFNQNSASELKNLIFDSSVTAATTSYSLYQASGNLYWRNGSGTAVQVTLGSAVNSGAGSISGMSGTDAGASYTDSSKTFNFFTDSGNSDYGKMAHADLVLFKFSDDNSSDTDYITIAANSAASGSSGTIYVPSENGTFLTTATSYAGAISIATSSSNANIALNPHGTGEIVIGNGSASAKVTSSGTQDLVLDTNAGTNSSSIKIVDAANGDIELTPNGSGNVKIDNISISDNAIISSNSNGNIALTPNGTGEVDISKVDIDGGAIDAVTIGTNSVCTDLRVDNMKMDANTISSTDTNGALNYDTNGTGNHVFKVGTTTALTVSYAGGNTTITGA